ncbi:hypothetical protein E2C01_089501 [Portunus trituberculatus]|uniref:Uncharacterized protein n=1 Tax=Portunus trituberculatus TaxID=210409 RepID=A0A5B7JMK7_PORTR|nr:hypothetical protein [Portunus trituberculatus]
MCVTPSDRLQRPSCVSVFLCLHSRGFITVVALIVDWESAAGYLENLNTPAGRTYVIDLPRRPTESEKSEKKCALVPSRGLGATRGPGATSSPEPLAGLPPPRSPPVSLLHQASLPPHIRAGILAPPHLQHYPPKQVVGPPPSSLSRPGPAPSLPSSFPTTPPASLPVLTWP